MFDLFKSKAVPQKHEIRDTLFGDMPLAQWANVRTESSVQEPWTTFRQAKAFLDSCDKQQAIAALDAILGMPQLESRHYLQAYHALRELGVPAPMERAKDALGVVVEVGTKNGLDLVAAYSDHHARYYNYSGAGVVWERPNGTLDEAIDHLLTAGQKVASVTGPWLKGRQPAPATGSVRINILTPSGLHFGQGAFEVLAKDPLGGPVVACAFRLMQDLMKLTRNK